jgi:hypothetical protein
MRASMISLSASENRLKKRIWPGKRLLGTPNRTRPSRRTPGARGRTSRRCADPRAAPSYEVDFPDSALLFAIQT